MQEPSTIGAAQFKSSGLMQDLRLIVLEGGSGTGKSSLASALQERLLPQQWLHFSTDTVLYCLPQSILDQANLQNDWTSIDTRAISRSAHACVCSLLVSGYRVIFDCVVMTERGARELLLAFQAHRPVLVRLTCSWEEVRRRTVARGDRTLEEAEHGFKTSGLHLVADHVLDTTNQTPAELADSLASSLALSGTYHAWSQNLARFSLGSQRPFSAASE